MKQAFIFSTLLLSLSFLFAQPADLRREKKPFSFDPSKIKRDPFQPTKDIGGNKNLLTAFDVTRFQLVAVLSGMGSPRAMILLPNKQSEIVKVGDAIGKNKGRVHQIKESEVVVKESYKDYQGKDRSYFTSLVMAE